MIDYYPNPYGSKSNHFVTSEADNLMSHQRIEASNSQLPLEPLANSDIPLVVIIDLLLLKNITKT